ncbi:thioredoxin domain-containing protein [Streptomyces sp. YU58]|uniref:thioredoxin domain-containing protein n=1 Tax=Streptomyces sp. SX92 TaxID=3158972 RepID=UPI0027B978DF|nr:thioredoxin domain-containing protein [Streptomyces coralus]WLW55929.1 thioredoxin domain-containing protein [Streptomyces coralus]
MRGGRLAVTMTAILLGTALAGCGQGDRPAETQRRAGEGALRNGAYDGLEAVPERLGADGVTITVGDPDAKVTVHLYEDPRCPVCEEFELSGGGPGLRRATIQRKVKTEYTLASFLDDRLGGQGSKKAVNALRAALAEGKFAEYHEMLYAYQPEEAVDGYTDAFLLELADDVEGLRTPAFEAAVKGMKYRAFVTASEKAYERAGGAEEPEGPGTPTAVINEVRIPTDNNGVLFDPILFDSLLVSVASHPEEWKYFTFPTG